MSTTDSIAVSSEGADVTVVPPAAVYTLNTESTIWGFSTNTVSYIFLGVAGVSPVLFIIVLLITMKCYSWHWRRRNMRYLEQYRVYQQLWQAEKLAYQRAQRQLSDKGSLASVSENGRVDTSTGLERNNILLKPSELNPNVYFRQTPKELHGVDSGRHTWVGKGRRQSLSNERQNGTELKRLHTQYSIGSEEARVMAAFDKIYDDLEDSSVADDASPSLAVNVQQLPQLTDSSQTAHRQLTDSARRESQHSASTQFGSLLLKDIHHDSHLSTNTNHESQYLDSIQYESQRSVSTHQASQHSMNTEDESRLMRSTQHELQHLERTGSTLNALHNSTNSWQEPLHVQQYQQESAKYETIEHTETLTTSRGQLTGIHGANSVSTNPTVSDNLQASNTATIVVPQTDHQRVDADIRYGVRMHVQGLPPSNSYQYTMQDSNGVPLQAYGVVVQPTRAGTALSTNAAAEDAKVSAERSFEQCSDVAGKELMLYNRQRLVASREALCLYANAKIKTARDTYALLAKSLSLFKQMEF